MKIEITNADDYPLWIDSYQENQIVINQLVYKHPFCIQETQILPINKDFAEMTIEDFLNPDLAKPELILIGTGKHHLFLNPELQIALFKNQIQNETMITTSACRTFNLLKADNRNVWAWFWFV